MKRKIVKQGAATMTVSLPTSWIKKFDLRQGDSIDVQEIGKSLVMTTESQIRTEEEAWLGTGIPLILLSRKITNKIII